MPTEEKLIYQAYADGVNDFITSVSLRGESAKIFPPEVYVLGLNIKPWLPTDSLGMLLVMHLGLTWDWIPDLTREFNKINSEELELLAD
jgi:acyl-homoserine lactone acylase PvdQ